MIYISTSCIKKSKIKESILELINNGFYNIELSGGTDYYDGLEEDIMELKKRYDLNLLIHNYFPPPKEHFVLNLASLDDEIFNKSLKHYLKAIKLANKLDIKKFGLHAGFLVDIKPSEAGSTINKRNLYNREKAIERFCNGFKILKNKSRNTNIYIENNVISASNFSIFNNKNPFMLTNYRSYSRLKELINFDLLLDIAHLKVSSNSLDFDYKNQLKKLLPHTNYIHISENNGIEDENRGISKNSQMLKYLSKYNLSNYTITVEIYDDIRTIKKSFANIKERLNI